MGKLCSSSQSNQPFIDIPHGFALIKRVATQTVGTQWDPADCGAHEEPMF